MAKGFPSKSSSRSFGSWRTQESASGRSRRPLRYRHSECSFGNRRANPARHPSVRLGGEGREGEERDEREEREVGSNEG